MTASRRDLVWAAAVALVFTVAVAIRTYMVPVHFAHVDDLLVATNLIELEVQKEYFKAHTQREVAARLEGQKGHPAIGTVLRTLKDWRMLPIALRVRSAWSALHSVPRTSTYAPAQFYLTGRLVRANQNYQQVKTRGRLPSLVFGVLAILVMARVLWTDGARWRRERVLVAVTLIALSWECVIYSAQMESYSIGVFAVACLLLLIGSSIRWPGMSLRRAFAVGLLLGGLVMMQYQLLFFLPAYVAAVGYAHRDRLTWKWFLSRAAAAAAAFACLFVPFVAPFLFQHTAAGVGWNAGPSNEFYLPHAMGSVWEMLRFFARNVPIVITAMLAPVAETSPLVPFVGAILLILATLGFYGLATANDDTRRALAVFTVVLALVWTSLLAAGKITFGPTRHSLVLVPVFTLLIVTGTGWVMDRLPVRYGPAPQRMAVTFALVWLSLFAAAVPRQIEARADRLSETGLLARLEGDTADVLSYYEWSHAPTFMAALRSRYPILDGTRKTPPATVPIPEVPNMGADDRHLVGRDHVVVAFYSTHKPFAMASHSALIDAIERRYGMRAPVSSRVIREERIDSGTEIEWSSLTRNGANGFYYTVVDISEAHRTGGRPLQ